jgi:IclR family transcriptional regulator, pca regulon regulatory protein
VLNWCQSVRAKTTKNSDRNLIASLAHGLSVLEAVAAHREPVPLALLADSVGMKKTSTWRLVHTLVHLGYVRQDPKTRTFQPAPRILALGYSYFDGLDLKQSSTPFLQDLAERFNETVNLAVQDGDEVVYIDRIRTSQIIDINLHVGSRLPLYNTSLGRALICEKPQEWLDDYMARLSNDRRTAPYRGNGKNNLIKLLKETRKLGFAVNDEELVKGLRSIACPIRDASTQIVCAIGIAGPSSRVSLADLKSKCSQDLISTAEKISMILGYRKLT